MTAGYAKNWRNKLLKYKGVACCYGFCGTIVNVNYVHMGT